jgi:hypothetical protein
MMPQLIPKVSNTNAPSDLLDTSRRPDRACLVIGAAPDSHFSLDQEFSTLGDSTP